MYEFFEQLLQSRGITTSDVCKATGIGQATISAWKKRGGVLGAEYLLKIAKFFDVPMEYFLGGELIEWNPETQEIIQTEPYYISDEAREMAQFLFENPKYRVLFDASRKVKAEDIEKVAKMIELMGGNDND